MYAGVRDILLVEGVNPLAGDRNLLIRGQGFLSAKVTLSPALASYRDQRINVKMVAIPNGINTIYLDLSVLLTRGSKACSVLGILYGICLLQIGVRLSVLTLICT